MDFTYSGRRLVSQPERDIVKALEMANSLVVEVARSNIDSVLLDSVDRTLTDLFGGPVTQAFYGYFGETFGFTREIIAPRLDNFLSVFSETFGRFLDRAIAKRFYARLGLRFNEQPTYTLLDYVKEAKMILACRAELGRTSMQ